MDNVENQVLASKSYGEQKIAYTKTIGINKDGEIVLDVFRKNCWENGSGFMISYADKICELAVKAPHGSMLRVFLYIAHNQQYGSDDLHFGYSCTKKFLADKLGLTLKSIYNALNWLKENFIVNEQKINGNVEFMVNPDFVTIGTHKKKRKKEWDRRCSEYIKKLESKTA